MTKPDAPMLDKKTVKALTKLIWKQKQRKAIPEITAEDIQKRWKAQDNDANRRVLKVQVRGMLRTLIKAGYQIEQTPIPAGKAKAKKAKKVTT